MDQEDFKVGDVVWVPRAGLSQETRPCRVCAGTKVVTLVLGTGEQVQLECGYCGHGFEAPTGIEKEYAFVGTVERYVIDRIVRAEGATDESRHPPLELHANVSECSWRPLKPEQVYRTQEAAQAATYALVAQHEAEVEERMAWKERDTKKSYAWNAGYHLRCAKDAAEKLAYHSKKAVLLKAKAKTEVKDA